MTQSTIDSEVDRILMHYKEYVMGVYQGIADYDEATAAHAITNLIAQEANKARLDELTWARDMAEKDITGHALISLNYVNQRIKALTVDKKKA